MPLERSSNYRIVLIRHGTKLCHPPSTCRDPLPQRRQHNLSPIWVDGAGAIVRGFGHDQRSGPSPNTNGTERPTAAHNGDVIGPLVPAAGGAICVGAILGGWWLQSSAKVTGHDGVAYKVRVGPTGVGPIAAYTNWDASACLVPIHLLRYLFGRGKTWSIQVTVPRTYEWGPLLDESYPDREAA